MLGYAIKPLDTTIHRREEFGCESPDLTHFLRERARKEMVAGASACFVLVPEDDPGRIAGFYTLSAAEISRPIFRRVWQKSCPVTTSCLPSCSAVWQGM